MYSQTLAKLCVTVLVSPSYVKFAISALTVLTSLAQAPLAGAERSLIVEDLVSMPESAALSA